MTEIAPRDWDEAAVEAAFTIAALATGMTREQVADNLPAAIQGTAETLPATGRLRKKRDRLTVKALGYLFWELPEDHPDRERLRQVVERLEQRIQT